MSSVAGGACVIVEQVKPVSTVQVGEQPSLADVLPSSQASWGNFRPSPQTAVQVPLAQLGSFVQVGEQPSYGIWLPSSHCSKPSLSESPHLVALQTVTPLVF